MPTPTLSADFITPATFALIVAGAFALCLALVLVSRWLALRLRPLWYWLEHRHRALGQRLPAAPHPALRLPVWLLRRNFTELALLMAAGLVLLATGAVFIEVTEEVVEPERLVQIDHAVFAELQALRRPWLDAVMVAVTELGGIWVTLPLLAAVAIGLWASGLRAAAAYWIGAQIGARLSVVVIKGTLGRDRPTEFYHGWEAYSFPSGHATTAMVTYGLLWVLLASGRRGIVPSALLAGTVVLIGLIGASRLYLGVHWLSDVIAGFALGLAWITLLALAYRWFHLSEPAPPRWLPALALAVLVVAWGVRCGLHFPSLLERYQPVEVALQAVPSGS